MQIFINRNNEKHGPYTLEQIQAYLASGQMQGSDPAWYEGVDGWVTLAQVPGVRVPQDAPPPYQPAPVPQPKKKKSPVLIGCGGLLLVGIIGSIFSPKTSNVTPTSSTTQSSRQSEPATPEEKVVKVSALQLFQAYQGNEIAADNQYKDKIVLVTGTIGSIGKDMMDDSYVTLKTSNPLITIRCVFEESEKSKLGQLSQGQTIMVRGTCHGKEPLGGVAVVYATLP